MAINKNRAVELLRKAHDGNLSHDVCPHFKGASGPEDKPDRRVIVCLLDRDDCSKIMAVGVFDAQGRFLTLRINDTNQVFPMPEL